MHSPSKPSVRFAAQNRANQTLSKKTLCLTVIYFTLFLIMLWAAYHGRLPVEWLEQFPNYDKVGHVILYFIPTYLGHRLCRKKHWQRAAFAIPVFPALFALFTITEELLQGLAPYRTLDAFDMVCSLTGVVLGYWIAQQQR